MSDESEEARKFEITTSLSITGGSRQRLDEYVEDFEAALVAHIRQVPAITAYFAMANHDAYEIAVGLRFEGMPARNIETVASKIIDDAIQQLASDSSAAGPEAVREESTLVPA